MTRINATTKSRCISPPPTLNANSPNPQNITKRMMMINNESLILLLLIILNKKREEDNFFLLSFKAFNHLWCMNLME